MVAAFLAFTCSSSDPVGDCPAPPAGSKAGQDLAQLRRQASFALRYPCYLPAGQQLESVSVSGQPGRQHTEMVFEGSFTLTLRQSQLAPLVNPDPTGASRVLVNLFPGVTVTLIEQNDGSQKALYHLFWEHAGLFYELQAAGPPQQRRLILQVAASLE